MPPVVTVFWLMVIFLGIGTLWAAVNQLLRQTDSLLTGLLGGLSATTAMALFIGCLEFLHRPQPFHPLTGYIVGIISVLLIIFVLPNRLKTKDHNRNEIQELIEETEGYLKDQ